jgi:hypothetical protein
MVVAVLLFLGSRQVSFELDPVNPEMCFYLDGSTTGKSFKLNFQIVGINPENVKFIFKDVNDGEVLVQKDTSPLDGRVELRLNVNYLHHFQLCWKSKDSEKKEINFYYLAESFRSVVDKGGVTRGRVGTPAASGRVQGPPNPV